MKKTIFIFSFFVLFSCGSYHNKIRKQPVEKQAKKETLLIVETASKKSDDIKIASGKDNEFSKQEVEVLLNDRPLLSDNFSVKTELKNTAVTEIENVKLPQDSLTDQEIIDIAFAAEKKSDNASLDILGALLLSITILGVPLGLIFLVIGLVKIRKAQSFEYNTQRGEKYLRTARIMAVITGLILLGILVFILTFVF